MIGRVGQITDTGRKRRRNEDAYVCEPPLFAIADGMGGAQAGEVASQLAAAAVREKDVGGTGEQRVHGLIQEANRRVYDRSNTDPNTSGMGTTMTVALVEDGNVAFGHVGDSRAYLIRDGQIEQLTEDHSLVNELMKSGKLSPEEAETHPQRSVITRALGTDPDVDVDTFSIAAQSGDLFLLCSDGLTDMVAQNAILDLVERNHDSVDDALKSLVKAANRGGGEDNITIVAFEIADVAVHDGQTQEQAMPPELQRKVDEEETLDETDAVPVVEPRAEPAAERPVRARGPLEGVRGNREVPPTMASRPVDTMVVTTEEFEDQLAEENKAKRRHRRRRVLAWLVLLLFVLAIAALVVWRLRH